MFAATAPSAANFIDGITTLFTPFDTLATCEAVTLYEYPKLAKIAFVLSAKALSSALNFVKFTPYKLCGFLVNKSVSFSKPLKVVSLFLISFDSSAFLVY